MNILISVDEKYLKISKVMLFSLKNNIPEKITVYVLFRGNRDSKEFISFEKDMVKIDIKVVKVDVEDNLTQRLKVGLHYSAAMYFRIFAHLLLPENIDRILYLDADLIVKKDITSFYAQDFAERYMVVCEDKNADSTEILNHKNKLGIAQNHKYFNSGVLLMNLKKMREDISKENILSDIVGLQDRILYPDQDILNKIYENKVKYNDYRKFNFQVFQKDKISKIQLENAYVIHFIGENKPWLYKGIVSNKSKYFWFYKCRMNKIHILEYVYTYILGMVYEPFIKIKRMSKRIFRKLAGG